MILLDSLYINDSGGKVLLDYLVEKIERAQINCYYLFDDRCKDDYGFIPNQRKQYMKASLLKRHLFYNKNKDKFSKVLCFGNLPPTIKLNVQVYTYFHQPKYLKIPKTLSLLSKIKLHLKTSFLNSIKSKTNFWLVQSDFIRNSLSSKYKIVNKDIILMPFYPPLINERKGYTRKKDGFVYISNGGNHKNHFNLIEAFCNYFDEYKNGVLHITISDKFADIINLVKRKEKLGYPIINHGFVNREELIKIYKTNKYLIFPSLAESFGLGLVEAIENGCNVLGADLPYTYAVCNPSIVFNPLNVNDIKRALFESQFDNVKKTEQLVFNQIDELILLLNEK